MCENVLFEYVCVWMLEFENSVKVLWVVKKTRKMLCKYGPFTIYPKLGHSAALSSKPISSYQKQKY